jgi:hypothetical protein
MLYLTNMGRSINVLVQHITQLYTIYIKKKIVFRNKIIIGYKLSVLTSIPSILFILKNAINRLIESMFEGDFL